MPSCTAIACCDTFYTQIVLPGPKGTSTHRFGEFKPNAGFFCESIFTINRYRALWQELPTDAFAKHFQHPVFKRFPPAQTRDATTQRSDGVLAEGETQFRLDSHLIPDPEGGKLVKQMNNGDIFANLKWEWEWEDTTTKMGSLPIMIWLQLGNCSPKDWELPRNFLMEDDHFHSL